MSPRDGGGLFVRALDGRKRKNRRYLPNPPMVNVASAREQQRPPQPAIGEEDSVGVAIRDCCRDRAASRLAEYLPKSAACLDLLISSDAEGRS